MRARLKRRGIRLAVGLTVGLLVATGSVAARGEVPAGHVLDNRLLGDGKDPVRGRDIPGLAVDPADPKHVVMIDEDFLNGQCDFHTSFDGGKTWPNQGHLTVPADFADPPCRTFDSGGYAHYNKSVVFGTGQNVYTTFASHRGDQQRPESNVVAGEGDSVIVNRSTDGGKTFQRGVIALEGAKNSRPFIIRPGVAVQPRPAGDRVLAVGWYVVNPPGMGASGGQGDRRAVVSTSEDGGVTWGPPVEAQGPDEKVREIAPPVVGPDGSFYIAWRNRDDPATAPHPIVVGKSTDGGKTWTRTSLGDVGPAPTTAPAPAGSSGYPRMAVDPRNGALYVVYVGFNFGDLDVILQKSTDGGTTWSAPLRVNDDPRANGVRQLTPQVFIAPNSRVDVVWVDTRTTYPTAIVPKPAGGGDVYYAASTDGGATFGASRRISNRTMNLDEGLLGRIGTYTWWGPAAAPLGNEQILFAWGDTRFSNVDTATNDIILATMQLGASEAAVSEYKAGVGDLSVAASQLAYPGGAERMGAFFTSKLVVVGSGDKAEAAAAAVLARANGSPLFVVSGSKLTKDQKAEIDRLHTRGLYVIGSTSSVSDKLVNDIKTSGVNTNPPPPPPTTIAVTTTAPATPTTAAAVATTTTIASSIANRSDVIRISGATPADTAKAVADALDLRSDEEKTRKVPAFSGAVVVNPDSDEASTAIGFAAALRYPILFVGKDSVPAATADAFNSLAIQNTFVVGGAESVSDAVMGKLPTAKRLGGAGVAGTNEAVIKELQSRGMPVNVVWVADESKPVDAAIAGAAVARVGGVLLLTPGADQAVAQQRLTTLGLDAVVDKIVVAQSTTSDSVPWAIVVISALLALVGLVLIFVARSKRGTGAPAPTVKRKETAGSD